MLNYINRATKGVYEFGSVFKTFTLAAGIHENVIEPETEFKNLEKSLTCVEKTQLGNMIKKFLQI